MNLADQCVELLVIDDDSLTEDQLKSHLDGLYENSARLGLSSDSVTKLVRYLIGTERISERTKIYVLENHLLPREFVASDCVRLILRTLGVCTVFRPYKECISKKLQIALVKWVCHIYPWVETRAIFTETFSLWFEYWRFDYLQQWITYIILWTFEQRQITKWRCKVLFEVGMNPGYSNSRANAVYLLKAFNSSENLYKDVILDYIEKLDIDERKIKTLASFEHNGEFIRSLKRLFDRNKIVSAEEFDSIWEKYHRLQHYNKNSELNILSVEYLAKNWENFDLPYDLNALLSTKSSLPWLFISCFDDSDPRICLLYQHLSNHPRCRDIVGKSPLLRILNTEISLRRTNELTTSFVDDCSWYFKMISSNGLQIPYLQTLDDITIFNLASILNNNDVLKLNRIISYVVMLLLNEIESEISEPLLMVLALLFKTASLIQTPKHAPVIHILADGSMEQIIASNEASLIAMVSEYLSMTKKMLVVEFTDTHLKSDMDFCVSNLIDYLWNYNTNKSGQSILPNIYWQSLSTNQYLSHTSFPPKMLYSIPNMRCLSYACQKLLYTLESECSFDHYDKQITDSNLKIWLNESRNRNWIPEITNYEGFRKVILQLIKEDGRYEGISDLLYTYLKTQQDDV